MLFDSSRIRKVDVLNLIEVNNVASDFGVPGVADGVIDQVVDEEVNKCL